MGARHPWKVTTQDLPNSRFDTILKHRRRKSRPCNQKRMHRLLRFWVLRVRFGNLFTALHTSLGSSNHTLKPEPQTLNYLQMVWMRGFMLTNRPSYSPRTVLSGEVMRMIQLSSDCQYYRWCRGGDASPILFRVIWWGRAGG